MSTPSAWAGPSTPKGLIKKICRRTGVPVPIASRIWDLTLTDIPLPIAEEYLSKIYG